MVNTIISISIEDINLDAADLTLDACFDSAESFAVSAVSCYSSTIRELLEYLFELKAFAGLYLYE